MNKLAIIIGHNHLAEGAIRPDTGEREYTYNSRMATYMMQIACQYELEIAVFRRIPQGGYSQEIKRVYQQSDDWGADASVELHFNSFADPNASGTETLSSGSNKSIILANEVQRELVATLGLKDRGVKIRNSQNKGRGYLSLISGKAPAIITEPFFASAIQDRQASDEEQEQQAIAAAILAGVKRAFALM